MKIFSLAGGCLCAVLGAGAANAQTISVVTTPAGSFTNSIGAAIAKVLVEKASLKAVVTPQQSTGAEPVNAGSAELGLASSYDVQFFVAGTVLYEGRGPRPNLRMVARMVPLSTAAMVKLDSPVKTLKDLKGLRVGSGFGAQKSVALVVKAQLANAGLTERDVQPVLARNINGAADDFAAGKTDVFWFALGSAKVKQTAAAVGGVRAIGLDDSPAALVRMTNLVPGSYATIVKPSKNREEVREPIPVMTYDMTLFTRASLSDETVYKITKAIHDNKKDMASTFAVLNLFEPEGMAKQYEGVQYHPGAIKFFREQKLWQGK